MAVLLIWESEDSSDITIDGENGDWVSLPKYSDQDSVKISNSNIDINEVSYHLDSYIYRFISGLKTQSSVQAVLTWFAF